MIFGLFKYKTPSIFMSQWVKGQDYSGNYPPPHPPPSKKRENSTIELSSQGPPFYYMTLKVSSTRKEL